MPAIFPKGRPTWFGVLRGYLFGHWSCAWLKKRSSQHKHRSMATRMSSERHVRTLGVLGGTVRKGRPICFPVPSPPHSRRATARHRKAPHAERLIPGAAPLDPFDFQRLFCPARALTCNSHSLFLSFILNAFSIPAFFFPRPKTTGRDPLNDPPPKKKTFLGFSSRRACHVLLGAPPATAAWAMATVIFAHFGASALAVVLRTQPRPKNPSPGVGFHRGLSGGLVDLVDLSGGSPRDVRAVSGFLLWGLPRVSWWFDAVGGRNPAAKKLCGAGFCPQYDFQLVSGSLPFEEEVSPHPCHSQKEPLVDQSRDSHERTTYSSTICALYLSSRKGNRCIGFKPARNQGPGWVNLEPVSGSCLAKDFQ